VRRQWAAIGDHLLANPAPARIRGRIIDIAGLRVQNIARAETCMEIGVSGSLRIVWLIGLLHGVEVIEDAVEFVESMNRRQVFIAVAKMILADLRCGITE